jgi:hypothetical protein
MNRTLIFSLGGIALLLLVLAAGLVSCRGRYTTAPFTTETLQPSVLEIRHYPELAIVTAAMGEPSGNNAFGQLFRYISGDNNAKQKIPMTTPVFIGDLGEKKNEMAFVMPASLTNPPPASSTAVAVRKLPPGTFAVLRFRGMRSASNESNSLSRARTLLKQTVWRETGTPYFAYYDPPWIVGPLRRNEVLIPVSPSR